MVSAGDTPGSKVNRETVIKGIAEKVVAPAYVDLDAHCRALSTSVNAFAQKPDAESLKNLRGCWKDVFLSAQRISCFKLGPVADEDHAPAFYFSPIRPASIEKIVNAREPMTEGKVEEWGAAAKGLRAIEYLTVAPSPEAALEKLKGEERRRLYLQLLADDVARHAAKLAKDWQPPISASAQRFIDGHQESMNALVNQLAWSVENLAERQIRPIIIPEKQSEPAAVDGQMTARLEGVQRILCAENGIEDLLKNLGSSAGERLKLQMENAIVKVKELEASEKQREKATAAYEACRQVELLIKVDAASALGVTMTFSPIDGD